MQKVIVPLEAETRFKSKVFYKKFSRFQTLQQFNELTKRVYYRYSDKWSPSTKIIFEYLKKHAVTAFGVVWTNQKTIAKDTNVGKRTVERVTKILKDAGIIEIIPAYREDGSRCHNIYIFSTYVGDTPMAIGDEPERPLDSKVEPTKTEQETKKPSYHSKSSNNTNNVPEQRKLKDQADNYIPSYIPKTLVNAIKQGFSSAGIIRTFYKKYVMFKRHRGFIQGKDEHILRYALEAWEYTKFAYRNDSKEWEIDRFYQCFYGTMVKIHQKEIQELREKWGC